MNRRAPRLALLAFLWPAVLAAQVRVAPLYPAAAGAWTGAVGGALASPGAGALPAALVPLSAPGVSLAASGAPLVAQLEGPLNLTPASFAALPPAERAAALELAAEAARAEVTQKAYALNAQALSLAAPGKALDKDGRAELYRVVAHLDELRARYGAYLDGADRAAVAAAYARASARAWEIRGELLGRGAADLGDALSGAGRDMTAAAADAAAVLPPAGAGAVKLLERMRASKNGWGADDIDALLTGFGFERRDGGKHRIYVHPEFPQLHETVSHQRTLPAGYVQTALRDVEELGRLRAARASVPSAAARAAPPAEIRLEDLAVLLTAPEAPKPKKTAPAAPRAPPAEKPAAEPAPAAPAKAAPAPARLARPQPRPAPAPRVQPPAPTPAPSPSAGLRGWLKRLLGR